MKATLIGIVPRTLFENGTYKVQLNYNYLIPFVERGISTIILPLKDANLMQILDECDGFLIPGGNDIDPIHYNEENTDSLGIDAAVDDLDQKVIKHALKFHKPVLGICRGVQSIAAFLGGSLHQDIKKANLQNDEVDHTHLVNNLNTHDFCKNFKDTFVINSYHHQAVKDIPADFEVIFKHHDIIEGIHHKTLPILGVQWHPERLHTSESKIIFDYLCDNARIYKQNKMLTHQFE